MVGEKRNKTVKTRVSVTMPNIYAEGLDQLVEKGFYVSRQEAILEGIRQVLGRFGIEPFPRPIEKNPLGIDEQIWSWLLGEKDLSHPECEKLNERSDEWNAIFPFIEWLQENRMCIAVWRDPEAPYTNSYTEETGTIKEMAEYLLEHPYPYGSQIPNLLYKYFDVDPAELERERREILESLREPEKR